VDFYATGNITNCIKIFVTAKFLKYSAVMESDYLDLVKHNVSLIRNCGYLQLDQ
jgi:hypothetical protein